MRYSFSTAIAALACVLALAFTPAAQALYVPPVGLPPLSSKAAAKLVKRSKFEPRPDNFRPNHRIPKPKVIQRWRIPIQPDMPNAYLVNGRFKGTTDEIIQWAAIKWRLDPDLLRAVAVVESWWHMSVVGDNGDSFGLFQVRRPYHCLGECFIARRFTAFNADYYGGIIRAYYDGKMEWLNTVERGQDYAAGDIWGSVGAWFSGRWHTPESEGYISAVQQRLAERTWEQPYFLSG